MTGLLIRFLGYVLVVVGVKNAGGAFWRHYGPRVVFALKVGAAMWLLMAVGRFFLYDHPTSQWLALAGAVVALGALYAIAWLVVAAIRRRRG